MATKYTSTINTKPFNVTLSQPLDVRTVVEYIDDLKLMSYLKTVCEGMVVYVIEDKSLYVCFNKPKTNKLTNVEDGWRKVDVDYSVRVVESESNLTDGTTILFPYQGMMAYVTSESALYVLLTKGVENAKDINNWRKISNSSSTLKDKVGIDIAPEGGSGFKITKNEDVIIEDYINVENHIKAKYYYTSKGVNSYDKELDFPYDSLRLSKGGESYIELYTKGDNWMVINDPDNSLGLSVTIKGEEYISGKPILKETFVCFGVDIKFHEGWTISYGDTSRLFGSGDYELIDIYRSESSPEVYAYLNDIDVRVLTEDDLVGIAQSIKIDIDGSDSDFENTQTLQQVIVNMNNSINKIEQEIIEPDTIEHDDIDKLFSE